MCKSKFYTKDEDTVILQCVSENVGNLTKAFKRAANQLERSPEAIAFSWYKHLRTSEVSFLTVGVNTKNFNTSTSSNPHIDALIAECEKKIEVLKKTIEQLKSLEI